MRQQRRGFSLIELLVVFAIVAILVGLTLAGVQKVRASAAKAQCSNQIRQLALALQQYHDANRTFPPGTSVFDGKSPQMYLSWLARILPYVEQDTLWKQSVSAFAAQKKFSDPLHTPISGLRIALFVCPADGAGKAPFDYQNSRYGYTSYLGVNGTDFNHWDGILHEDSLVKIADITDGTSQTLLLGERHVGEKVPKLGWWYAGVGQKRSGSLDHHLGTREINNFDDLWTQCFRGPYSFTSGRSSQPCDTFHFWSNHSGGAYFAFADGSVKFLSHSANVVLPALSTKAGNDGVPQDY